MIWHLTGVLRKLCAFAAILPLVLVPERGWSETRDSETRFALYFHNANLAGDAQDCRQVFAVARAVPATRAVARAALNNLFVGPSSKEREQGYFSPFSTQTASILRNVSVHNSTAYVDLHDIRKTLAGVSSSCGSAEFLAEIESTLRQFATVKRVILAIEGRPDRFYEWIQRGCDHGNDYCDPGPFSTLGGKGPRRAAGR